jgi:cytochrome P450
LEYLDAVISETLRIFPPATALERSASEDIVLGSEQIKVNKGDIIHVPVYALHRDPENFPEPESFKPERFLAENRSHHPYSYLPFGAGPRNCVARRLALMEAKLALLYSVYNFKFSATQKTDVIVF